MNQRSDAGRTERSRPALRFYVHVPYCASRCGYCDFNTYVPGEAGRGSQDEWRSAALAEVRRARRTLAADDRPVSSVFFGGGTPTLLPVADLVAVVGAIRDEFGLTDDCEITTEANPENVTLGLLDDLLAGGFTRLSIGMQSADESVLRILDRRHRPGGAVRAARLAGLAGFEFVSLDLIYGTPGETDESWRRTLAAVIDTDVGHVSAYALKVEPGTALARRVRAGEVGAPADDEAAARYEVADDLLSAAGLPWYEISNWARPGHECRHNLGYWTGDDWWGVGPGAHSHLAGRRWWNVRHPTRWTAALSAGADPGEAEEILDAEQRRTEDVMLGVRLASGFDPHRWGAGATGAHLVGQGLAESMGGTMLRLSRRGRLLADAVTLSLLGSGGENAHSF